MSDVDFLIAKPATRTNGATFNPPSPQQGAFMNRNDITEKNHHRQSAKGLVRTLPKKSRPEQGMGHRRLPGSDDLRRQASQGAGQNFWI
jgi:hypothetical protein